jgi:predicted HAD superfamily Cof-like phosphohydrolase
MQDQTFQQLVAKVEEFQRVFGLQINHSPNPAIDPSLAQLRYTLMKEENEEYLEACQNQDLTEIADALGDKLYILLGTIITHGLQDKMEAVFTEIHRSNMSKLDDQGKPLYREDGKILKSNRYFRPDIATVLAGEQAAETAL